MQRSTIPNPNAGPRLFRFIRIEKTDVVGYYYLFLVFAIQSKERHNMKRNGGGVIQVTA